MALKEKRITVQKKKRGGEVWGEEEVWLDKVFSVHQKSWMHSQSCQSPHIIFAYVLQGTLGDTSLCVFSISSPLVTALGIGSAGSSVARDTFKACSSFYLGGIVWGFFPAVFTTAELQMLKLAALVGGQSLLGTTSVPVLLCRKF